MDLDVVFLGTSGSMPTAQRAPAATLLRRGGERILIDCGEGTQRQLLRSDVGLVELREIFLTHYHADHFLGLPGMLKTFALRGRETRSRSTAHRASTSSSRACGESSAGSPIRSSSRSSVRARCSSGTATASRRSRSSTAARRWDMPWSKRSGPAASTSRAPTRSVCPTARAGRAPARRAGHPRRRARRLARGGPRAARPGRKIVFTGDTAPCHAVLEAALGADLLVHEATFCLDERERAKETVHSTAAEAAEIARRAEVGPARAHAPLDAVLRLGASSAGPHRLRDRSSRATST